ncbi:hypothetical protein HYW73_03890 [Candidatus Nomurabacteria bacterium]|nr:hypothetical protein [Candidatus Nomurabacteria bacterium]
MSQPATAPAGVTESAMGNGAGSIAGDGERTARLFCASMEEASVMERKKQKTTIKNLRIASSFQEVL